MNQLAHLSKNCKSAILSPISSPLLANSGDSSPSVHHRRRHSAATRPNPQLDDSRERRRGRERAVGIAYERREGKNGMIKSVGIIYNAFRGSNYITDNPIFPHPPPIYQPSLCISSPFSSSASHQHSLSIHAHKHKHKYIYQYFTPNISASVNRTIVGLSSREAFLRIEEMSKGERTRLNSFKYCC